ncbi:alpha-1,4-N-acetylglucosaminyltransferase [Ornithorhynchus anatinus]|uniref:Alpha-1,4-N-acetylglucosaminyltransferase n=1 Tax=Ornithorhynchus anatinus TaxID=9258 RepID=F6UKK3_ORNAN|nr:alpha-1,4-N-acetylglucosaminyltransferase [Ornithorhynchus anatinus]
MLKELQISLVIILMFVCGFLYEIILKPKCFFPCIPTFKNLVKLEDVVTHGRGIFFLETSDRLEPPPLVSCAVESASRIYRDRPVVFFLKGLNGNLSHLPSNSTNKALSLLSRIANVFLFPLDMKTLLQETPLSTWYSQINPQAQKNWLHISSDASRLAVVWKFGGIYMDTDVISIRPIPSENFLAGQSSRDSSNGVFGFVRHHPFLWQCMENFVENYNGDVWGHQGPALMTRVLELWCNLTDFQEVTDLRCQNLSFLHPHRFYPIFYPQWKLFYEVWAQQPTFNDSYALHLWNYMNQEKMVMVPGSNTLVENLYRNHCPGTYENVIRSTEERGELVEPGGVKNGS